jgi:hypothetical protein
MKQVHGSVVFHHPGSEDEFIVIAAYKKDLDSGKAFLLYFCDEKTGTLMSAAKAQAAKWACFMHAVENDDHNLDPLEIGIYPAKEIKAETG